MILRAMTAGDKGSAYDSDNFFHMPNRGEI